MQKRILIVRTDRVGDVVMITPMIREIRRTYPDAFISALTKSHTKDILLNNPHLNECITDDLSKETFWKVVKEIRRFKFTDALLVMPTERTAYQLFFAGIPNRIGVGRKIYEVITFMKSVSRNDYNPLRHEADYCMDLARQISIVTNNIKPEIFVTAEENKWAESFLKERSVSKDDLKIFIHTGTLGSAPNWREENWLQLIKQIDEKLNGENCKIILTALEMSEDFLSRIENLNNKNIINISQDTKTLRELISVISQADIFISSSTGPAHLADALNKKCIVIHCNRPMNCAKHWGILNEKSVNLEVSKEFCDNNCSADKEVCRIEEGLKPEDVMNYFMQICDSDWPGSKISSAHENFRP